MGNKKTFTSQNQVSRAWEFIDKLSRKAWERNSLSQEQKKQIHNAAAQFHRELSDATRDLPQSEEQVADPPKGVNVDEQQGWRQFALDEFVDMVGRKDVCTITDAYLKTTYLLEKLDEHKLGYVFRGHRDISWPLIPRKGRELRDDPDWQPPSSHLSDQRNTFVLNEELDALSEFQVRWNNSEIEDIDELDKIQILDVNNPEWWFRMQHYDNGDATRMLDVTTSINAALLFACVDWSTGELDDNQDGVLYLWPVGQNANKDDFLLRRLPNKVEELFAGYPDAPVFILNPPHNERSKAQSGAFYWWPKFWEEPPYGAAYYLRIPKSAKHRIVTELLKLGFGPKDAVRGKKGLQNEQILRKELGFPEWKPLGLDS